MKKLIIITTLLITIIFPSASIAKDNPDVALAKMLIKSLENGNKVDGYPHIGPLDSWELGLDTFTNEVSSETIESLYSSACNKLIKLYKDEVKTYFWSDLEGWPRMATVVQFKIGDKHESYLIIRACQNNDNDSFYFSYKKGEFNIQGKKLMHSWKLPKGHLRSSK